MKTKAMMFVVLMSLSTVLIAKPEKNKSTEIIDKPAHRMNMKYEQVGHEKGLNLTDAQKEAIKQTRIATQKEMQPLKNELGELQARQKTLATADKPDLAAINKNIEKIGAVRVEMAKIKAKQQQNFRAQLTDEQKLKFDAMKDQHHQKMGSKRMRGEMETRKGQFRN